MPLPPFLGSFSARPVADASVYAAASAYEAAQLSASLTGKLTLPLTSPELTHISFSVRMLSLAVVHELRQTCTCYLKSHEGLHLYITCQRPANPAISAVSVLLSAAQ